MIKRLVQNLLHKELSYQIHGAAIEIRKDFGPGHKEKLYQEALVKELKRRNIMFEKEKAIKIYSPKDGQYIGLYRPDFIVDNKIIVEVKAEKFVKRDEFKRLYDYLRNSEYELAYFINFASPKLFVKRIIFTNNYKPMIKKLLVSISLILALISGVCVEAAQLGITSQVREIGAGQQFQVDLILDTENEEINAVEGKILFLADLLELKEIRDGDSIINFWVERPVRVVSCSASCELVFSGIIPGGFQGVFSPFYEGVKPGKILSLIFQTQKEGQGAIEIKEAKVLLNDGKGTPTQLSISNFQFNIKEVGLPKEVRLPEIKDSDSPEAFEPIIAQDPAIFDGKHFLVFVAQDKGSGIHHYELQENRKQKIENRKWEEAESPYVLKDQKLRSFIYVKAIDRVGNERIAMLPPRYPMRWYERPLVWGIIILLLVVLYIIGKILWPFKRVTH